MRERGDGRIILLSKALQPLAADIADVYRELPGDMAAERTQRLIKGLGLFLKKV